MRISNVSFAVPVSDDGPYLYPKMAVDDVVEELHKAFGSFRFEACGGWRREKSEMKDLDVVVFAPTDLNKQLVIDKMERRGFLKEGKGMKSMVFQRLDSPRIEMSICEDKRMWGAYLLHTTGCGEFNRALRTVAISKGMILSQHGLRTRKEGIEVCSGCFETDILDKLGIGWVEPKNRTDGKAREIFDSIRR